MVINAMSHRILYQFPQSHFAEKARWLLDAKGLDYQVRNLYPVLSRIFLWPRTGIATIPALHDAGKWVADSTCIALYLDRAYPNHPALLADDPGQRAAQMEVNALSEKIGVLVRQVVMIYLIDTSVPVTLYYQDAPLSSPMKMLATWVFRRAVKVMYQAYPEHASAASARLSELFDQAERLVLDRQSEFLIGDRLSLADISLASMLAPLLGPAGTPWASITGVMVDQEIVDIRQSLSQRPLGQYIYETYERHRHGMDNWRGSW